MVDSSMDSAMTVSLDRLRQVLTRLLDELAERHGSSIELTADFYWVLDPAEVYEAYGPPTPARMTLAQLSDDLAELSDMALTSDPPVIWHDLSHVVGILQRLAVQDRP